MSTDFSEIFALRDKLARIEIEKEAFIASTAKELAARLLRKVKERTPVSQSQTTNLLRWKRNKDGTTSVMKNKDGTAKTKAVTTHVGGTLRRGWTIGNTYAGNGYCVIVINNGVFYASYVEYWHRQTPGRYVPAIGKRLKKSFVEGKKMLEISIQELERDSPAIVEQKIQRWLEGIIQ